MHAIYRVNAPVCHPPYICANDCTFGGGRLEMSYSKTEGCVEGSGLGTGGVGVPFARVPRNDTLRGHLDWRVDVEEAVV